MDQPEVHKGGFTPHDGDHDGGFDLFDGKQSDDILADKGAQEMSDLLLGLIYPDDDTDCLGFQSRP